MLQLKLDTRVYPIDKPKSNTKAFASISIGDLIAIRDIRIVEGERGLFIAMPQSKDKNGEYYDVAFPLTADLRKEISGSILAEYQSIKLATA